MSNVVKEKLKIEGMHCSSCAMSIDFDLEDLEGVQKAKTNYASQEAEVQYDETKITRQKILEQIKKTGYTAVVKTA